jgi:transposase
LIKVLWFDGDGLCLFAKRLERGRFIWPQATSGTVSLTPAQLSMLLEGIDWRRPVRTQTPQMAAEEVAWKQRTLQFASWQGYILSRASLKEARRPPVQRRRPRC